MKNLIILLVFTFATLTVNAACVSGDCEDGFGTFIWEDGAMYVGFWKGGKKYYFGMQYWKDGDFWYGLYKEGIRKPGLGLYVWDDGDSEVRNTPVTFDEKGCVSGNCQNGWGVYIYDDGGLHAGYWKNGKQHYFGAKFWISGDFYFGLYNNGNRKTNRHGMYAHNDGTIKTYVNPPNYYETGCVEGDCNNGFGTYIWKSGDIHTGFWKDGVQHYLGIKFWHDKDFFLGIYKEGKRRNRGLYVYEDGTTQMRTDPVYFAHDASYLALNGGTSANNTNVVEDYNTNHIPTTNTNTNTNTSTADGEIKIWAVIVGVANYPNIKSLNYTDDDAYRVANFLQRPEGGAIPDEQLRILIDESATKSKILYETRSLFGQADADDVILFYFSGHGMDGAFLPRDFTGSSNQLYHSEIRGVFESSKAKHKICLADACHSGSLDKSNKDMGTMIDSYYNAWNGSTGGTALMMSSKAEETSIEYRGLRQGVFSYYLIKGLKGEANKNNDKIVTITELFDYVKKNVQVYTSYKQTPVINGNYDRNMPISVIRD
jgi:hypothetical protein